MLSWPHSIHTSKTNIYSYGVLIIHSLCGRWPFPEDTFHPDPRNPTAIIPVSEIECRAEYLQEIDNDHPLMGLICQCLSNMPTRRPEAPALLELVNAILSTILQTFTNRVEMFQQLEARIQTLIDTNQSKQLDIDYHFKTLPTGTQSVQSHWTAQHTNPGRRTTLHELRCAYIYIYIRTKICKSLNQLSTSKFNLESSFL